MIEFDGSDHIKRWFRLKLVMRIRAFNQSLHVGIVLLAILFGWFIASNSQVHEILRSLLDVPNPYTWQLVPMFVSAMLLSCLLFFVYRWYFPFDYYRGNMPRWAQNVGQLALYATPLAPWIGTAISIQLMSLRLSAAVDELKLLQSDLPDRAIIEINQAIGSLNLVDGRSNAATALVCAGGVFTLLLLWRYEKNRWSWPARLGVFVVWSSAAALFVVFGVMAAAYDYSFVPLFKSLGPFTSTFIAAIGVLTLGVIIVWALSTAGISAMLGVAGAGILLFFGIFFSEIIRVESAASSSAPRQVAPPTIDAGFSAWLRSRAARAPAGPIPVVMFSAQGGGLYAAAVSSLFLTRLHETEPQFKKNIFTISAVSGGSVGAALFSTLAGGGACQVGRTGKTLAIHAARPLEAQLQELLLERHLSVVLGNLPADILRSAGLGGLNSIDRSDALAASLIENCPALSLRYRSHWDPAKDHPALILNATWTSNGHRVAFAPFSLRATGDGTLWSFSDVLKGTKVLHRARSFDPTIAQAAVTSARFPVALPPLSLMIGGRRNNFGDGGYSDASGVTTATEILAKVKQIAQRENISIKPLLAMITFDYRPVNAHTESGTPLVDSWAPISALLGVRENLSRQAITRAIKADGAQKQILQLSVNPEDYGIALGFRLSRTSYKILSVLVGRPQWCPKGGYQGDNPILHNSCVAASILELVKQ